MNLQPLEIQQTLDPLSDLLDDLAALGEHWKRNREKGRIPFAVRSAILMVARDALAQAEANNAEAPKETP